MAKIGEGGREELGDIEVWKTKAKGTEVTKEWLRLAIGVTTRYCPSCRSRREVTHVSDTKLATLHLPHSEALECGHSVKVVTLKAEEIVKGG